MGRMTVNAPHIFRQFSHKLNAHEQLNFTCNADAAVNLMLKNGILIDEDMRTLFSAVGNRERSTASSDRNSVLS